MHFLIRVLYLLPNLSEDLHEALLLFEPYVWPLGMKCIQHVSADDEELGLGIHLIQSLDGGLAQTDLFFPFGFWVLIILLAVAVVINQAELGVGSLK